MTISEAVEALEKKHYILLHSDKLDGKFFLKRHKNVVVKDAVGLPEYTLDEIRVLKKLSEEDRGYFLKVLYNIKLIFNNAYIVFD